MSKGLEEFERREEEQLANRFETRSRRITSPMYARDYNWPMTEEEALEYWEEVHGYKLPKDYHGF
jgi:hypothetical protein